jgi:hypothetical protein
MSKSRQVGVLAFGSLILDPGPELQPRIVERIKVTTPFAVEFTKYSTTRGSAPTLAQVTHDGGPVDAIILVLDDEISADEATHMLWRRETHNVGTGKRYRATRSPRAVRVQKLTEYEGVACVLYTDFYAKGKIANPKPTTLARHAIKSVQHTKNGKDGISYLMQAMRSGISTPLMNDYQNEILRITDSESLPAALEKLRKQ